MDYFTSNRTLWIGQVLSVLIFTIIVILYDIPSDAWQYAALLIFVTLCLITALDAYKFYKKHRRLQEISKKILVTPTVMLNTKDRLETDYIQIIHLLTEEITRITTESDISRSDMLDYYSMWVHQIKTPISAMHLILQSSKCDEKKTLQTELFKTEQYVEMALNYLRLDTDTTDFLIKPYDVSTLAKSAIKKYKGLFIEKNISLIFDAKTYLTITDEKWFSFALEQLISNALKYTSSNGSIRIFIDENSLVISDTGYGIQKEDVPRVFEKGFTGYNGRLNKQSTGIGLYLCKRILYKLSHDISLSSEPGVGTTVKIHMQPYKDVRLNREM